MAAVVVLTKILQYYKTSGNESHILCSSFYFHEFLENTHTGVQNPIIIFWCGMHGFISQLIFIICKDACMHSRDIAILIALQWFSVVHHSSLFQYFFIDPTLVEYSTMLWAYTYFEKNWNRFVMELHKSYRILFIFMEQIHHFLTLKFQDRPFHPMNQMVSFWQGWNSQIIVLFWHCS